MARTDGHCLKEKIMKKLEGFQKKYLRGLAHNLKPVVFIGQNGVTLSLINSLNEAFEKHELIKVKFIDYKEKEFKEQLTEVILKETKSLFVGLIGHNLILFKRSSKEKNQVINIPTKKK